MPYMLVHTYLLILAERELLLMKRNSHSSNIKALKWCTPWMLLFLINLTLELALKTSN
jgi:hypothetical protein